MAKWLITFTPEVERHRAHSRAIMDASEEESTWEPLYDEVQADSLDVSNGALLFSRANEIVRVYGAGCYLTAERK